MTTTTKPTAKTKQSDRDQDTPSSIHEKQLKTKAADADRSRSRELAPRSRIRTLGVPGRTRAPFCLRVMTLVATCNLRLLLRLRLSRQGRPRPPIFQSAMTPPWNTRTRIRLSSTTERTVLLLSGCSRRRSDLSLPRMHATIWKTTISTRASRCRRSIIMPRVKLGLCISPTRSLGNPRPGHERRPIS